MSFDFDTTLNTAVLDVFATTDLTYYPAAAAAFTLRGEIRRDPVELGGEGEAVSAGRQHSLGIRLAECPSGFSVTIDIDEVDIAGQRWRIIAMDDNGEGFLTLYLHEVS